DPVARVPAGVVELDRQFREVLLERLLHPSQVLFLALAGLGRGVQVQRKGLIPATVLVRDQNHPPERVGVHQKTKPLPACPGKFRQVLDERQALRPARDRQQVVVVMETQPLVQELVEACLEAMVAAVDDEDVGVWTIERGSGLEVSHQDAMNRPPSNKRRDAATEEPTTSRAGAGLAPLQRAWPLPGASRRRPRAERAP